MVNKRKPERTNALKVNEFVDGEVRLSFLESDKYDDATHDKCVERFEALRESNMIIGDFDDDIWYIDNDLHKNSVQFDIDPELYYSHGYEYMDMDVETLIDCIKCFIVLQTGTFIAARFRTLINYIRTILENIGDEDKDISVQANYEKGVRDFFVFSGIGYYETEDIFSLIRKQGPSLAGPRSLANIINYLALDEEVGHLFETGTAEEKLYYFPVYFWAKVTFILPLRVTETCLTPYDCIRRDGDSVYITVRRTNLKLGRRLVHYNVTRDYTAYEYRLTDSVVIRNIEWYIEETKDTSREFLFFNAGPRGRFLGTELNRLIREFTENYLLHTKKYNFAKAASGLEQFEPVCAGDARHIAMSNLLFSSASIDVCRQLANQHRMDTSMHYASNIKNTITCSTIMGIQKKINDGLIKKTNYTVLPNTTARCMSVKRRIDPEDISDCEEYGQLSTCLGCPMYMPTQKEIEENDKHEQEELMKMADDLRTIFLRSAKVKGREDDMKNALLLTKTEAAKYKRIIEMKYEQEADRWLEAQNSTIIDS